MKSMLHKLSIVAILCAAIIPIGCSDSSSPSTTAGNTQNISGFYYSFDESGPVIIDDSGNN